MHEIFRHRMKDGEDIKLMKCYQETAISTVLSQYRRLIHSEPPEERVQEFLAQHTVMWSFLAPQDVLLKPRISTHLTADFAILSPTKTLYFVEIEKPQTKLVKQRGGQNAELQAGKDQIDTWRTWITDHRPNVLAELRIAQERVHDIKFILVAGLESVTQPDDLRAVRAGIKDDTLFYTFDDLESFVRNIDITTKNM
jgi:hypothetical protein